MAVCALWPETTWELASLVCAVPTDLHATTRPRETRHTLERQPDRGHIQPLQRRTLPPHTHETRERPRGRRETSCHACAIVRMEDVSVWTFKFLDLERGHRTHKLETETPTSRYRTSDTGTRAETDALFLWCGFMTCLAWPALASAQRPPAPCAARARSGGCRPPSRA